MKRKRPVDARRALKRLWSAIKVDSCADGSMRITPVWRGVREYTEEDGGGPGLLSRLQAAGLLEILIRGEEK